MTAKRNLEWGGGVWLRAEGAIQLEGPNGLASGNFENWNFSLKSDWGSFLLS